MRARWGCRKRAGGVNSERQIRTLTLKIIDAEAFEKLNFKPCLWATTASFAKSGEKCRLALHFAQSNNSFVIDH